jgi:hypothetical protein
MIVSDITRGVRHVSALGKYKWHRASMLHPIVKPWPFRGWGLDFIGEIHPSSSKGHICASGYGLFH